MVAPIGKEMKVLETCSWTDCRGFLSDSIYRVLEYTREASPLLSLLTGNSVKRMVMMIRQRKLVGPDFVLQEMT